MFFSFLGGTPRPEPEQVIKNYTEELKTAPDEVGVMGAMRLLVLLGFARSRWEGCLPVLCWKGTSQIASGACHHALDTWV